MKKGSAKPATEPGASKPSVSPRTLAVDIGGTGIKALTLDPAGKPLNERTRTATPKNARPKEVIAIVRKLAKVQPSFERVSVGFPGVVKDGTIYTAANLGKGWAGFDLRGALERKLKKPVRIANDADIQGLGCVTGHGLELVITLGTGFGSVLFADGTRVHLELGHHPFHRGKTYEDELGERALKKKGRKRWSKLLQEAIVELKQTFNYDRLYIGGGNGRLVNFKLPEEVKIISNEEGLLGGIALWRDAKPPARPAAKTAAKPAGKPAPAPMKPQPKAVSKPLPRMAVRPAPAGLLKPAILPSPRPAPAPVVKTSRAPTAAVAVAKAPAAPAGDVSSGTATKTTTSGPAQASDASKNPSGPLPTS